MGQAIFILAAVNKLNYHLASKALKIYSRQTNTDILLKLRVIVLLLDLLAAFDTVNYHILLPRLSHCFGINVKALEWFASEMCNRYQSVYVEFSACRTLLLITSRRELRLALPVFIIYTFQAFFGLCISTVMYIVHSPNKDQ